MSYQPQTEAATSRFLNVEEAGKTLRMVPARVLLAGRTSAAISIRW